MKRIGIVDVMLRHDFQNLGEDAINEIDFGGIFYINSEKKVFMKVNPFSFTKEIHAHDNKGNKYIFLGGFEKVQTFYKDSVVVDTRLNELRKYAHQN